jgi:hypothetical protein
VLHTEGVLKKRRKKLKKTVTHGLAALREHRHLLTSSPLALVFSAIINATTIEGQPTYAIRVRAFKLLLLLVLGCAQSVSQAILLFLALALKTKSSVSGITLPASLVWFSDLEIGY